MRSQHLLIGFLHCLAISIRAANYSVTVNGTASHAVPDTLFGIMYEDISSGDGGLYAELLQNRAFQQVTPGSSDALLAWSAVGGAEIDVVNTTDPISSGLLNSLQVVIPSNSSGSVGVMNVGYTGINVNASWIYNASFNYKFAEGSSFSGALTASLVNVDGTVLASASQNVTAGSTTDWTSFFTTLTPDEDGPNTNNSFQVTLDGAEAAGDTIFFSLFSLFPPTFKDRENGMRMDLAQTLADLKPAFFRFPGGNNLGQTIDGRWIWNNTVGPLVERPGRLGDWGYINTDGLGLLEYIHWLEDMDMQAIMAVWAGYSFGGVVTEAELGPYVQEAISQIEFVTGNATNSAAAALRSSLGHPVPFPLKWVEIGNEDFSSDTSTDTYQQYRWPEFEGNLSANFPNIEYLATTYAFDPVLTPNPQSYDVHVYQTPTWFYQNAFYYDDFERNGTKYFEGEYAAISTNSDDIFGSVEDGRFQYPIMSGSAAEAAFMTGLERNSDIVFAASYAPLLQSIDDYQWTPNLISFDAANVIKSTSYYVQQLFSLHKGTEYLPSTLPTRDDTVHWSVVRDTSLSTPAVYIKVANAGSETANVAFTLPFSVASTGTLTVLSGGMNDSNTPAESDFVVPVTSSFSAGQNFTITASPFSVNVLNLATV